MGVQGAVDHSRRMINGSFICREESGSNQPRTDLRPEFANLYDRMVLKTGSVAKNLPKKPDLLQQPIEHD
jgi:hypothetical protein